MGLLARLSRLTLRAIAVRLVAGAQRLAMPGGHDVATVQPYP